MCSDKQHLNETNGRADIPLESITGNTGSSRRCGAHGLGRKCCRCCRLVVQASPELPPGPDQQLC